jgi:predicted nucleotidyltransferase
MDILETLRRQRPALERLSFKTIALFGSYAKDAQTESSDLDFVVEFSAATYDNFASLEQFLEQLFGRRLALFFSTGQARVLRPGLQALDLSFTAQAPMPVRTTFAALDHALTAHIAEAHLAA